MKKTSLEGIQTVLFLIFLILLVLSTSACTSDIATLEIKVILVACTLIDILIAYLIQVTLDVLNDKEYQKYTLDESDDAATSEHSRKNMYTCEYTNKGEYRQ